MVAALTRKKQLIKHTMGHVPPAGRRTLNIWFGQNGALVLASTQQLQVMLTLATVTFIRKINWPNVFLVW